MGPVRGAPHTVSATWRAAPAAARVGRVQLALPLPGDDAETYAAALPPAEPLALPGAGDLRARLRAAWAGADAGAPAATGRALAATLAPADRTRWAATVLDAVAGLAPAPIAGVGQAIALAAAPARWPEAHDLALTLDAQARRAARTHGPDAPRTLLLGMAASVAQLAYASAGGLAPFDGEPAARLTTLARALVERAHDPALEARVWRTLAAPLRDGGA